MKQHVGVVLGAKITNIVSAFIMAVAGVLVLCIPTLQLPLAQRLLLGILFGLVGLTKIFGFFSNDLYRLAFQFDFAMGIFCCVLSFLVSLMPEHIFDYLPMLIGVYVLLDALLKLQMALDARRFGMRSWWIILTTALVLAGSGLFVLMASLQAWVRPGLQVGLALILSGLENLWITAHTVHIRVKKKNLMDQYDLEA